MYHYTNTKTHLHILVISIILAAIIIAPVTAIPNESSYTIEQITKNNYQPVELYSNTHYYKTTPNLTHILEYVFIQKALLSYYRNEYCVYLNLAGHGWITNKEPITFTTTHNINETPSKLTPKEIAQKIITDIKTNKTTLPDRLLIDKSVIPYHSDCNTYINIAKLKELYPEIQTREFKWISTGHTVNSDYFNHIWGPTYHPKYTPPTQKHNIS